MEYDFSHIPVGQPSKPLHLNKRWSIRTAYGQLIALVFVPICILALIGAGVVLYEVSRSAKAQQFAEAQAVLSRYEPVVSKLSNVLEQEKGQQKAKQILQSMLVEEHLSRAAVFDSSGNQRVHIGRGQAMAWPALKEQGQLVSSVPSKTGHVYGIRVDVADAEPLWLMVDMDNTPLRMAQYRVMLALAVVGLITVLLLLLCLNIYAKRWIAPIYEMRMHLQHTNEKNLYQPMHVVSSGELNMLQRDIVFLLRRLHVSYQELKEYAEQTEDDLRHAFDEMELQTISIRNARDAAVTASEAKSAFLANISHELRTPLNSIDGFINLLARRANLTTEQNMYVQTIRKSSAHLLALVNDVLDFSKIEAGKLVLEQQEIDLHAVIYEVVDMLTPLAVDTGIELAVFYYDDVPTHVVADALRCKQILTNLVSNALKFTQDGEVIVRVSLAENVLPNLRKMRQEHIVISVQDSGSGVQMSDRKHLFKSFSQGDPSITRQYGGTGLGLVISKQLVQLMGGDIGYQDNATDNIAKKGSTFWFSLPLADGFKQPQLPQLEASPHVLAYIEQDMNMQILSGLAQSMGAKLTKAVSTAGLLERLKSDKADYDWVIVGWEEDVSALIRGIREHYQGKLAAFGYQISLDFDLLAQYDVQALYQPINRRSLVSLFQETLEDIEQPEMVWQGKHVLAVDDHLPNLMVLDALLAELGVSVTTVNSGADAIETYNRHVIDGRPFDLIFMDIQMPRMSGIDASRQIRALEKQQGISKPDERIPIIALTAHALADERDRLLAAGVDDYVGKPISQPHLIAILNKWFDDQWLDGAYANYHTGMTMPLKAISADAESDSSTNVKVDEQSNSKKPQLQTDDVSQPTQVEAKAIRPLADVSTSSELQSNELQSDDGFVAFDWQDALSRSANKPDLAKDILRLLIDSLPQEKQELQSAWQAGDITKLAQIVHRVVGGTRYTGVPALRHIAQKLQQQCIAHQDETPEKAQVLLVASYEEMLVAIDDLLGVDFSVIPDFI